MALWPNATRTTFRSLPTEKRSKSGGVPVAEYRRALEFLRPHWRRFLPLIGLNFVSTAVTIAQPYLTKLLIDEGLSRRDFRSLELFALWMGVCAALSFGFGMLTTFLYTKLSALVLFDMRLAAFRKLQNLSPQFYATTKTGDIVSRLNNDVGELQRLSSDTLLSLPANILFLIGNAVMMFYLNVKLSLIGVAMLPAGIWAMRRYQGRLRQKVQTLREYSAEIGSFLIEAILGMRLLVSCNAQERKNIEFRGQNNRFVDSLLSMQLTSFMAGALPGAVITLSVAILFLYGGNLVIHGVRTLGSLMAFMAYHGRLLSPVQGLMASYSALITGSVSLSRVFELLDAEEEVVEKLNPIPISLDRGSIAYEHVSFRYRGRDEVLKDLSFTVSARTTSVIVGPSGAGKSTLVDLLMRFYDPASGVVRMDGHDLKSLRLCDLRRAVSLVEQTPFFFHSSIRENLQFASPDAALSEMRRVAQLAGIHEFIDSLPNQYESVLGERGLALSAGPRQRLAIARALLRNPSILVLDEPSAALDPNSEWSLGETLRSLATICTIVIVTHRAALVEFADQVIVLENGRVIESGDRRILGTQSALSRHFRDGLSFKASS
jgi:ATP-binding cassette subfamily B protein